MDELPQVNHRAATTALDARTKKRKTYIENVQKKCSVYKWNSFGNWLLDNILQIIILGGAAVVPFLLNIAGVPKLLPTILSAVVAVAAVLANYFKFGQRARNLFRTYIALEVEQQHFDLGTGNYKNLNEEQAFDLFVAQVDQILSLDFQATAALEEGQQRLPERLFTGSEGQRQHQS